MDLILFIDLMYKKRYILPHINTESKRYPYIPHMAHPSHKDHVPNPAATCGYIPGTGRRDGQNRVGRASVLDLIAKGQVTTNFVSSRTPDKVAFPTIRVDGHEYLDVKRINQELNGRKPTYATITMSRTCIARLHDLCVAANELDDGIMCHDDFSRIKMTDLVGAMFPIIGQVSTKITQDSSAFMAIPDAPEEGGLPPKHDFVFRPVILSTLGDGVRYDQGEVVAQGVVVSPRAFNFPEGTDHRLRIGLNPRFEDSMCWVLITHAYDPLVSYASMNKGSLKKQRRDPDCPFEKMFKWEAYRDANRERINTKGYKISNFGLADTKQTGKQFVKAMVPWSIAHVADDLRRLREESQDPSLHSFLVSLPMTFPKEDASSSTAKRKKGGMDLRRMLMCEYLLQNTPLEALMDPGASVDLGFTVKMPGTAADMWRRAKEHADAHFAT